MWFTLYTGSEQPLGSPVPAWPTFHTRISSMDKEQMSQNRLRQLSLVAHGVFVLVPWSPELPGVMWRWSGWPLATEEFGVSITGESWSRGNAQCCKETACKPAHPPSEIESLYQPAVNLPRGGREAFP